MLVENPKKSTKSKKDPKELSLGGKFSGSSALSMPSAAVSTTVSGVSDIAANTASTTVTNRMAEADYYHYVAKGIKRLLAVTTNFLIYIVIVIGLNQIFPDSEIGINALVIYFSIQFFFMAYFSQSVGKKLFGIRVVDENTLQKLTIGKYLLRELIDSVLYIFSGIGIICVVFRLLGSRYVQTVGSSVTGALVIRS
ncbi:RDD family protein [Testudinibacter sp. TR-2022]|uniref:RDD family protein n=1 Tax=Testudinibacter sp. TR-2022 TaxID=2585029 RepID=UPI001117FA03|nr:RDD family protein [Testudinibacter sp. TR-2022]TNH03501.1 RDD family protein [Pasteurellaceae bacterium Phil31]TNH07927.1 RDD family protein [Testudinibacter sp. TR-2022]TNH10336.1 RDD family protein [Testudinibacter sp. TR-2022]TNH11636.1 RDD family protein [Testudinibacter sp. TR-2022]TNH20822.1 RDD family protein [Testudinibacter sp. TR-2022]